MYPDTIESQCSSLTSSQQPLAAAIMRSCTPDLSKNYLTARLLLSLSAYLASCGLPNAAPGAHRQRLACTRGPHASHIGRQAVRAGMT